MRVCCCLIRSLSSWSVCLGLTIAIRRPSPLSLPDSARCSDEWLKCRRFSWNEIERNRCDAVGINLSSFCNELLLLLPDIPSVNISSLCRKLNVLVFFIVSVDDAIDDEEDDATLLRCCVSCCCCCENIVFPIGHALNSIIIGLLTNDSFLSSPVSFSLPPVVPPLDDDAIVLNVRCALDVDEKLSPLIVFVDDDSWIRRSDVSVWRMFAGFSFESTSFMWYSFTLFTFEWWWKVNLCVWSSFSIFVDLTFYSLSAFLTWLFFSLLVLAIIFVFLSVLTSLKHLSVKGEKFNILCVKTSTPTGDEIKSIKI